MKRRFRKIISLALIGIMTFSMGLSAVAQTKEEAQERIEQLEEEKQSLQDRIAALKTNQSSTEQYISQLDEELTAVSVELGDLNTQIADIEAKIVETEASLAEAKEKESVQYEVLKLRIKTMYERGNTSYIEVLFSNENISKILSNSEYISQVSEFDNRLLESLGETRQSIADYEVELTTKKTELEAAKVTSEAKQEELGTITEAKRAELGVLNENIDNTEDVLSDVEEDLNNENEVLNALLEAEAAAQAEYERIQQEEAAKVAAAEEARRQAEAAQAEADRLKAEAAAADAAQKEEAEKAAQDAQDKADQEKNEADQVEQGSGGSQSGSGNFMWPLPGYTKISSYFGSRICPFHGPENHDGIDVPAPGGTPILAADSGVVTAATYHYSLGNYVIINHGNGYSTYYLHASRLNVKVGQTVSKGSVVSYVGTTGSSTGNHLDFRVKNSSGYLNPLNFVTPG